MKWWPVGFHVPTERAIDMISVTHHARLVTFLPLFVTDVLVNTFGSIEVPFLFLYLKYYSQIFFSYNVIMNVSASHNLIMERNNTNGKKIKKFNRGKGKKMKVFCGKKITWKIMMKSQSRDFVTASFLLRNPCCR